MEALHADVFMPIRRATDISAAKRKGKIGTLMSVEGTVGCEGSLAPIRMWHQLGVRLITLCHNGSLPWVDSSTDKPISGGISNFGHELVAELNRLDWSAVDLNRGFIEIRAGQAKTASRRVIPISDNLAAWLAPLPRKGKIVRTPDLQTFLPALARALKIDWPRNVLRDSFISYRIAIVQSADQVALEAGNSPSIIFKHYRELATPNVAEKWFSILPKDGQWNNTLRYDRKKRRVILNGVEYR
jgi:hypothetical protein